MGVFGRKLVFPVHYVFLGLFVALLAVCLGAFFGLTPDGKKWYDKDGPLYVLTGGIVAGLVVAIIQYFLSWFEFKQIDIFRRLKVKSILTARDDEKYYLGLIESASRELVVQGVTGARLLEDFASANSQKSEKRALLDALSRGVQVRLLLADKLFLVLEDQPENFTRTSNRLGEIARQFPGKFHFKYYAHPPAHSIFISDENCIVGPKFPGIPSKDTPAIHTVLDSVLAQPYKKYFDEEWKNGKSSN